MPVDWKSPDSFTRLLAATVASLDGQTKLNYKRIADFYGEGATYDAIEGRFRNIKKQAGKLKEEVDNGRAIAPPRGSNRSADSTPRKPKTPRNQSSQDAVLNGRVTKSNNATPTRRRLNTQVKPEMMEAGSYSATSSSSCTDVETPASGETFDNSIIVDDSFGDFSAYAASFDMLATGSQNHASLWDIDDHVV